MAEAVAEAITHGRHLAVAAGTGTGKSLAYLVPAVASGRRVVVATATKALQDQLAGKDLPIVAAGLGGSAAGLGASAAGGRAKARGLSWAVLKGRSNYLCRQRLVESAQLGDQQRLGDQADAVLPGSVGDEVRRVVAWSETTKSGDRAELEFEPSPQAWSSLSVSAEECPGARRCPSGSDCFAEAARRRAEAADVVVVNLHLLGAHVRSGGEVLPDHDVLVVDEAHELEDVLAATLGTEVTPGRLRGLAASARSALLAAGIRAQRGDATSAGRAVEAVFDSAERLDVLLSGSDDRRQRSGLEPGLDEVVGLALERLERLSGELRRAGDPERQGTSRGSSTMPASGSVRGAARGPESSSDAAQRCLRALLGLERAREDLTACRAPETEQVVWVTGGTRPSICSAPLDVATQMAELVFEGRSVVLTSATLPPGLATRLGAPPELVSTVVVASPFDYQANGLLYCATELSDPRARGGEAALHDEIEALVTAAGGRTLALFTSWRAMTAAAEALSSRLDLAVLVQGKAPKAALLSALTDQPAACLFATMSFWQGVDVPGAAITLVVIDKIPFPRPDNPLIAARRERAGAGGFRSVDLPRAATLLAQGAGRLIRTATDRGVVAILDPRLATASYGPALVKALPPMRRTRDRAEVEAFLRGLHAEATAAG